MPFSSIQTAPSTNESTTTTTTGSSSNTLTSSASFDSANFINSLAASSNHLDDYQARYEQYKLEKLKIEQQQEKQQTDTNIDRVSLYGMHVLTTELVRLSERIRDRVGGSNGNSNQTHGNPQCIDSGNSLLKGVIDNLYEIEDALRATDASLYSNEFNTSTTTMTNTLITDTSITNNTSMNYN